MRTIDRDGCREITFTSENPEQLIGRSLFEDDLISPDQATIKMDGTVLAVIDNKSEHTTWVDGRRLIKGERAELKHGMILTFGQSDKILSALSFRCNIRFSRKPSARRLWRFQESPARIERKNRLLNNTELASYMPKFSKNHDDYQTLTLDGLLLLHKEAGMQGPWFDVPLPSGATVRIKSHLKRGTVWYENAGTKQKQDGLLSFFQKTMIEFTNKAYAFVDGEARSLTDISLDLEKRASRTITAALHQIEGVLSVGMGRGHFVAMRDPKIPVPTLNALQRVLFRDGLVTFEDSVGEYKDESFKSGDKIIPQNTNPLWQGHFDPVTAAFGTLGHFVSTLQEPEMSDEREERDVEEEQEKAQHYAVTIGHVLEDDTTQATLVSDSGMQQTVSIPEPFRRVNSTPAFLPSEQRLNEVACLRIPPGMLADCAIPNVDCGGLCDLLGIERPDLYSNEDFNRRCAESFMPYLVNRLALTQTVVVEKLGAKTGLTEGYLIQVCDSIPYTPDKLAEDLYYGVIAWIDGNSPFAEDGDSGSLVYMPSGSDIVPIGIHKGSEGSISYCLLLNWVVGTIAEVLDCDLLFCASNCSGP